MELNGKLEDYESDVKLQSELENEVTIIDENGAKHVYCGGFYDLVYEGRVIRGNVYLSADTHKSKDKHAAQLSISAPKISNWSIDDSDVQYEIIREGLPSVDYRNAIERMAFEEGKKPTQRLLDSVFAPIEAKLLDAYAKLWGK